MLKFSVVIPAYNASSTIEACLRSLERQSLPPDEIIIVDDGSTDNTVQIIESFKKNSDIKVELVRNSSNSGICYSLNHGIAKANCSWIARMDADDICRFDRFQLQFEYIKLHQLDICGSAIQLFDKTGDLDVVTFPETNVGIRNSLLFSCPIAHPTVIFNQKKLTKIKYDRNFEGVEDLALWINQASSQCVKFGNVPKPLLKYRITNTQYSRSLADQQKENMLNELRKIMWASLSVKYNLDDGNGLIHFLKDTQLNIGDELSQKRLKYFSLRIGSDKRIPLRHKLWIIWFAGIDKFFWEKIKSLL